MPPKKNIPKNQRPNRRCPACGQMQPGTQKAPPPHKPGGRKRREVRRAELLPEPTATGSVVAAPSPDPIDAMTVIKGVAARVPETLEAALASAAPPTSAVTAAVRKAVLDEFRTRAQFSARLAEIDALLWSRAGDNRATIEGAMTAHLRELRLLRITEPEESDRFMVAEGEGDAFELLRPAYVDELTGKVILAGQLRRIAEPTRVVAGEEA